MITCDKCSKVLLVVEDSKELQVRGVVVLKVLCQGCNHLNVIRLYEYDKSKINMKK
jgi:phage FluMu protein Com